MRKPRVDGATQNTGHGGVRRDEVLSMKEVGKRFGWGERTRASVIKAGLPVATVGRAQYTTGAAVYDFIAAQMAHKGGDEHGSGEPVSITEAGGRDA